jgi:hypothetical protein
MMPGDRGRHQIDYVLVKQRFRNQVKICKTYPEADTDSDHNMVLMKCNLKFKSMVKRKPQGRDVRKLRETEVRVAYEQKIDEMIPDKQEECTDSAWNHIKTTIVDAAEKVVGRRKEKIKKPWITDDIVKLIEERKQYKNSKEEEGRKRYKAIRNEINRKARKAKEYWMEERCKEVEKSLKTGKVNEAYRIVRKFFIEHKKNDSNIMNSNGDILLEKEDKANHWKKYLEKLYDGKELNEKALEPVEEGDTEEYGDTILKSEFERAVKDLRENKASGVDDIPAELIRSSGKRTQDKLFKLICAMYERGEVPLDFQRNTVIPIPKKAGPKKCEEHRTISITTYT